MYTVKNSIKNSSTQTGKRPELPSKTSRALAPASSGKTTLDTTRFGRIEIFPDRIIHFPRGLIGFAEQRDFVLFEHAPDSPFHWLQSVDLGELAFPLADPDKFLDGFVVVPPHDLTDMVGAYEPEDLWLGVIVTFSGEPAQATLNLKAPLILNTNTNLGVQVVVDNTAAEIRYPIGTGK